MLKLKVKSKKILTHDRHIIIYYPEIAKAKVA